MTYLSIDDGATVAPGLLSAVLSAMRASFQRRTWLDAFDGETATLYSWAVVFRFGVPIRFRRSHARRSRTVRQRLSIELRKAQAAAQALRKALDYQARVQGGAS